jgi:hypothetical protein
MALVRWLTRPPFVGVLLAIGLPYWLAPYERIEGALGFGYALVALVAMITVGSSGWGVLQMMRAAASAAPIAAALRVAADVARDPTSHNLWPIELVFVAIAAALAALAGGAVGALFRRLRGDAGERRD